MDWETIGALAGVVSAIGTVVGLFFVYRELRSVKRNQYATASQNIVSSEREIWQIVLTDDSMVELAAHHLGMNEKFLAELGITARNALELLLFFRQYENLYYQHVHGMLPPDIWEHWKSSMIYTFKDDMVCKVLVQAKVSYTKGFREFVEKEVIPKPLTND